MAFVFKERNPPPEWAEFKARAPHRYLVPFFRLSWASDRAAYTLGKWPLVELLEYLGSFSQPSHRGLRTGQNPSVAPEIEGQSKKRVGSF
jgi:hypothetical protein